jgi:hypothetical protein
MTSHVYLAYHHNWSSNDPDFRRHWLLLRTAHRGSNTGTAYDVIDPEHNGQWERRKKEDHDVSESGTFQDKVVLGQIKDEKIADFENVIDETVLPAEGEDCQNYVIKVVQKLVEKMILDKKALVYITIAPSK